MLGMRSSRRHKQLNRLLRAVAYAAGLFAIAILVFSLCSRPRKLLFAPTPDVRRHPEQSVGVPNYNRDEVDTFYTYPEWYIVWSYQAKADFQQQHLPSGYPYFGDIGQFWQAYSRVYALTRGTYAFATGDHIMLAVIGSSLTLEYTLKGFYEETIGRLSEWTSHHEMVAEDAFAAKVAENYAAFVHVRPFYEFSFAHALHGLWTETPFRPTHLLRTLERRGWLSLDYAVESVYCQIIEIATHATYGHEDLNTGAWIEYPPSATPTVLAPSSSIQVAKDLGPGEAIVEIPRYQEFTQDARVLIQHGVRFRQIAGNELLVISAIAPGKWTNSVANVQLLFSQSMLTDPSRTRVVLLTRVNEIHRVIPALEAQGVAIEHLYDY